MAEFTVSHPFGESYIHSRIRVYAGMSRVDFHTEILNNEEWVRYRALFPTTIAGGRITHEIPFGAIDRPERELPAQNWVDYGDGERGVAILNKGLPGNNVVDGTLMLSLMRASQLVAYSPVGGFDSSVSSSSGQDKGKRLAFDYALLPHDGDWRDARVYRAGIELNNPLIVRKTTQHTGRLPTRWGLLQVSADNVVVSAVKTAKDGSTIVRVYEADGRATTAVELSVNGDLRGAQETNLIEDVERDLPPDGQILRFDLGPFEIKTFKLRMKV